MDNHLHTVVATKVHLLLSQVQLCLIVVDFLNNSTSWPDTLPFRGCVRGPVGTGTGAGAAMLLTNPVGLQTQQGRGRYNRQVVLR